MILISHSRQSRCVTLPETGLHRLDYPLNEHYLVMDLDTEDGSKEPDAILASGIFFNLELATRLLKDLRRRHPEETVTLSTSFTVNLHPFTENKKRNLNTMSL